MTSIKVKVFDHSRRSFIAAVTHEGREFNIPDSGFPPGLNDLMILLDRFVTGYRVTEFEVDGVLYTSFGSAVPALRQQGTTELQAKLAEIYSRRPRTTHRL